jgi:hypothetical protein
MPVRRKKPVRLLFGVRHARGWALVWRSTRRDLQGAGTAALATGAAWDAQHRSNSKTAFLLAGVV